MSTKKYKFLETSIFKYKKNAQVVGEFIEEKFPNGGVKPKIIVDLARPKSSPLHKFFDWDDAHAAEMFRRKQAGDLIASLQVVYIGGESQKAYESVILNGRSYEPISKIRNSQNLTDQVIAVAIRELEFWELKYRGYQKYFKPVFLAIKKVKRKGVQSGKKAKRD